MHLYGQYCPVARACEILADRWTPLIVRELLAGIRHFNELDRGLPGISRALLVDRLRRLEQTGVVERRGGESRGPEYHLTAAGRELQRLIDVFGQWGAQWAFGEPRPSELDPVVLLWWMKRRVHQRRLPPRRVVVQFDFRGDRTGSYWLVLERADVSVCLQHPKFDIDLRVAADIRAFYCVWLGRASLRETVRNGLVRFDGAPEAIREFPLWFAWSPMAGAVQAAMARRAPAPSIGAAAVHSGRSGRAATENTSRAHHARRRHRAASEVRGGQRRSA